MQKRVICVSWNEALAKSRELLLRSVGLHVRSAVYTESWSACGENADLLVLGHSVPRDEKRLLIQRFRLHSSSPVLSLLLPGEDKLPEATVGVEASRPEEVLRTVRRLLAI